MPANSLSAQADGEPPSSAGPTAPVREGDITRPLKRGALIKGAAGLFTPPLAGLATIGLGASPQVVALVIAMALIPSIPMLACAYVWSRGALKAIRAADKGDPEKSGHIISAMTGALQALPSSLGGNQGSRASPDTGDDQKNSRPGLRRAVSRSVKEATTRTLAGDLRLTLHTESAQLCGRRAGSVWR